MPINSTGASRDPAATRKRVEPLSISIATAKQVSGLGHTKLFELIKDGRLKSTKLDGKRLVNFASLKSLVGAE